MDAESFRPEIRYTLDGKEPGPASKLYAGPVTLKKSATLRAGVLAAGKLRGPVTKTSFRVHAGLGRTPVLGFPYRDRYSAGGPNGLIDGLRGNESTSDGRWQGFEGDDLVATIDLGRRKKIESVAVGFLQNIGSWIFFPRSMEIAVSDDGKDFRVVKTETLPVRDQESGNLIETIRLDAGKTRARFVRVTAVSIHTCPEGHPGAGGKAWLFSDEIIIN
jgi:hexosaminidase